MLREFKIWPEGTDPHNLDTEQQEFIVYLMANAPSLEHFNIISQFEFRKEQIENTDWSKEAEEQEENIEAQAGVRGITVEKWLEMCGESLRDDALTELREEFPWFSDMIDEMEGDDDDDEKEVDSSSKVKQFYANKAEWESLKQKGEIERLWRVPDFMRKTNPDQSAESDNETLDRDRSQE